MSEEFSLVSYEDLRGLSMPLNPEKVQRLGQLQELIGYVSTYVHLLADSQHPVSSYISPVQETQKILESRGSEFWIVGEKDMQAFAKAAMIYPPSGKKEAYPAIVLNQDRFIPFDGDKIPETAKRELILAIGDLPLVIKVLQAAGTKILTPQEFMEKIKENPRGQRIVPIRDLIQKSFT